MAFQRVCSLDNLWEGEMEVFEVDGEGVNLDDAELVPYPMKIENNEIYVGL